MTRKQKILAKIRAWIDRRLPRDVLRITIYDVGKEDGDTFLILYSTTHVEEILRCKMGEDSRAMVWNGKLMMTFTTEHLSP